MSFVDNLRMRGIFNGAPNSELGPTPSLGGNQSYYAGLLGNVLPQILQNQATQHGYDLENIKAQQAPQFAQIAQGIADKQAASQKPMDVIYKPPVSELMKPESDYQKAQIELGKSKLNETDKLGQQKLGIQQGDLQNKQARTAIYDFKSKHPDVKLQFQKGGTIQYFDPIKRELVDTGIDSGLLSDEDKINLQGEQNINAIDARGQIQKDLQGTRGEQRLGEIAAGIAGRQNLQDTKPNSIGSSLPSQQRIGTGNKARELMNTRPDLAPYIQLDAQGNVSVKPSGNQMIDDAIQSQLYGKQTDINLPSGPKKPAIGKKTPTVADPLGIR